MTPKEKKEQNSFRAKLLREFPGGIAEVRPIEERRSEQSIMITDRNRATHADLYRNKGTSIPLRVSKGSGKTNPLTGSEGTQETVLEFSIYPISGRTDRFPQGAAWFKKPIDLLEALAKKENGWGKIYRLYPVDPELITIEESAMEDEVSQKLWDKLQTNFESNEEYSERSKNQRLGETNEQYVARTRGDKSRKVEVLEEDYDETEDDLTDEELHARRIEEQLA